LQNFPKGVSPKMRTQKLEIYVYTVDGEEVFASCEYVTLNFVPTSSRAWTAASMGTDRY